MSGRLIILPHKSWHVWKKDNIEKVKRDERLHDEEEKEKAKKIREVDQESRVDLLKQRLRDQERGTSQHPSKLNEKGNRKRRRKEENGEGPAEGAGSGVGQGWGGVEQHVNFFADVESEDKKPGKNKDYERERQEKELLDQRRNGVAPVALGEGLGGDALGPWYQEHQKTTLPTRTLIMGRTVVGDEAERALDRDEARKLRADPMARIVPHRSEWEDRPPPTLAHEPVSCPHASGLPSGNVLEGQADATPRKHKKAKKELKKKSSSHKHKKKSARRSHSSSSDDGPSSTERRDQLVVQGAADPQASSALVELRKKRLEREKQERQRESRLLAERQIAGLPIPDTRDMAYSSQFNPLRARQNAPHSASTVHRR